MDHLVNGAGDPLGHFLRQPGDHHAAGLGDLSLLRLFLPCNHPHDAGFSGPVAAHETDSLTWIDLEINLIK